MNTQAGMYGIGDPPRFALLVPTCQAHGISKSVAFRLVRMGLLETFKIGTRRYVYLASFQSLPQRLAGLEGAP